MLSRDSERLLDELAHRGWAEEAPISHLRQRLTLRPDCPTPRQIATSLVDHGVLTEFQSEQLLRAIEHRDADELGLAPTSSDEQPIAHSDSNELGLAPISSDEHKIKYSPSPSRVSRPFATSAPAPTPPAPLADLLNAELAATPTFTLPPPPTPSIWSLLAGMLGRFSPGNSVGSPAAVSDSTPTPVKLSSGSFSGSSGE